MNNLTSELKDLYGNSSKHSNYQNVPAFVTKALGYKEEIDEGWRGDIPRLDYIKRSVQIEKDTIWGDFGANTGFFTLSLANQHPQTRFQAIEANQIHSDFILKIASHFEMRNVQSKQKSIELDNLHELDEFDVLINFNVLHHAGHDFDSNHVLCRSDFAGYAKSYLKKLRKKTKIMFFQMGSNLGGDKALPLVEHNDEIRKLELFASYLLSGGWKICDVAYPTRNETDQIYYKSLPEDILKKVVISGVLETSFKLESWFTKLNLDQFPGEFYRRPIFLCSSIST